MKIDNHLFAMLKKYAAELSEMEGGALKILVNMDGTIYETTDGADFADLQQSDVEVISGVGQIYDIERSILAAGGESKAMVLSKTPFCTLANRRSMKLIPALDDMAQIVGPQAETVPYEEKRIRRALKKATGCFVSGRYTISTGRSLFEAVVALQILEKSAEINIKAGVIGGPVAVAGLEARFMRQNYKRNYSKSEAEVKSKEGRT